MKVINEDEPYDDMIIAVIRSPKKLTESEGQLVRDIVLNTPAYYSRKQKMAIEKMYERVEFK